MAITVKRFVVYSVAAGVMAVLLGRSMQSRVYDRGLEYESSFVLSDVTKARNRIPALATSLEILRIRDSVATALRTRPAPPGLSVILPARATGLERRAIDSTVRAAWTWMTGDKQRGSTVLIAVDDASANTDGPGVFERYSTILLPSELDGRTCVLIYSARPQTALGPLGVARRNPAKDSLLAYVIRTTTGPCAFHARYGAPGAGTESWLRSEAWRPAWIPPQPPLVPPRRNPQPLPSNRSAYLGEGISPWFDETGRSYDLTGEVFGCLGERDEFCSGLLHSDSPAGAPERDARLPAGIVRHFAPWGVNIDHGLLAYIERELGPERFAQFWRSAKNPDLALAELDSRGAGGIISRAMLKDVQRYQATAWPTAFEWGLYALGFLVTVGPTLGRANRRRLEL